MFLPGILAAARAQIVWKRMRLDGFRVLGIEPVTSSMCSPASLSSKQSYHPKPTPADEAGGPPAHAKSIQRDPSAHVQPSEEDLHRKRLNDAVCQPSARSCTEQKLSASLIPQRDFLNCRFSFFCRLQRRRLAFHRHLVGRT